MKQAHTERSWWYRVAVETTLYHVAPPQETCYKGNISETKVRVRSHRECSASAFSSHEVGKNVAGLDIFSGSYRPGWLGLLWLFQRHLFLYLLLFETTCLTHAFWPRDRCFSSKSSSGTSEGPFTHDSRAEKVLIVCKDGGEAHLSIGQNDNEACQHPGMNSENHIQIFQSISKVGVSHWDDERLLARFLAWLPSASTEIIVLWYISTTCSEVFISRG